MKKILQNLEEATRIIQAADHITTNTYPLIKENRILLHSTLEIKKANTKIITAILQYEYLYKRIRISFDHQENYETFKKKCAQKYEITLEEIKNIEEIIKIYNAHKKSPIEISKNRKIIILSKNMEKIEITFDKTKKYILNSKNLLGKTFAKIKKSI